MTLRNCEDCGGQVSSEAETCPHCGKPTDKPKVDQRRQKRVHPQGSALGFGLAGVALLLVGCFLPIVSLPIVGGINLYQNGEGDGVIVIAVALLSLLLIGLKRYGGLMPTGLAAGGIVGYDFYSVSSKLSDAEAGGMGQFLQLQWGWAVLFIGAILLIVAWAKR